MIMKHRGPVSFRYLGGVRVCVSARARDARGGAYGRRPGGYGGPRTNLCVPPTPDGSSHTISWHRITTHPSCSAAQAATSRSLVHSEHLLLIDASVQALTPIFFLERTAEVRAYI